MCNLRLEDARLVVCTHAHSDHCGQAATIVERAGCELWMHPNHEHLNAHGRGPRGGVRTAPGGRAPERRARGAAAPLRGRARRARTRASPGRSSPTATCSTGVTRRHRPRRVDRLRDARPRALARLPVPARAAPADLRRSPARAHLAVLRLRLLARPRRRVPELARRRRAARRAPVPGRARAHVHRRARPHPGQPRARAPSASQRVLQARRRASR